MKLLRYSVGGVLVLLALLFAMFAPSMPRFGEAPAQPYVVGLLLLVWGVLLIRYQTSSYKGGTASVFGAFLLGVGVWGVCGEIFWREYVATKPAWARVMAEATFVIVGVALLVQGHRIHKMSNAKRSKDI